MSIATISATTPRPLDSRRTGRSVAAVFLGILVGAVLSVGTDQILHTLAVYPPWGTPMHEPGLNLLALSYRCVFQVMGFYVMARLAPRRPIFHVAIGALIGFGLALLGVAAALTADLGPIWYPVVLAFSSFPCAWLAVVVSRKRAGGAGR